MGDGFANGVIRLENEPRAVFYAGQEISGSLLFELNQPLSFSVLTLTFLGEANVLWTENQKEEYNRVVVQRLVKYIGYEEYFKFTEFLAGGQGISKLPAGSRCFPFKYRIPFTAPSSFTGEKGSVNYSITACLVNSDPMAINEELVKEFKVIAPMDLNVGPPNVERPIEMEFEEVYGCDCFCSPEPMTIRIRLPVTGYCSGQVIPVSVHIENNSSTEINKIIFQLLSKERYRSKQPIAEYMPAEKVLTTYKSGAVLGKSQRSFTCDLTVPDMIPLNLENCSIIDFGYFFRITVRLSGCSTDLKDESEIYFGLIPIIGTTENGYVHPMAHSLPIVPLPDLSKQYETVDAVNPAFVEPTNTPYSKSNNNHNQNSPYPSPKAPHPSQISPYPSHNSPYPGPKSPYPPQNALNPSQNSPYPSHNSPYPPQNALNPSKTSPYPSHNLPYPASKSPYPPENVLNPSQNSPYPPQNALNPSQTSPYPSHNSPYPPQNVLNPSQNSPYPPQNALNPSQSSPYPSHNSPYPPQNILNPSQNSPYPAPKSPYTSQNVLNPSQNSPYPSPNAPYSSPKAPIPSPNAPYSANKLNTTNVTSSEIDQCPGENPSYTSRTPPYPADDISDIPLTTVVEPKPFGGYQIGFKPSENLPNPNGPYDTVVSPPYPLSDNMPGVGPPYPTNNSMPGPHLPPPERDLRIYLPPVSPRVEPSAPPPSS